MNLPGLTYHQSHTNILRISEIQMSFSNNRDENIWGHPIINFCQGYLKDTAVFMYKAAIQIIVFYL